MTLRPLFLALLLPLCLRAAPAAGPGVSPDDALARLRAGNGRFVQGALTHPRQDPDRRSDTATNGQRPFAIILACADSRVPPEILFDQGVGDLFVIRVAGNVAGPDETASIEYAAEHLGARLCVVLGHSACGAVKAAVAGGKLEGNLPALIAQIDPAVAQVRARDSALSGEALLAAAIDENVKGTLATLLQRSPLLSARVRAGDFKVVGGVYRLATGEVAWQLP